MKPATIVEIAGAELGLRNGNRVFTSLEGENPGGSMKDHMVYGEIEHLLKKKLVEKNGIISEVSAGSTATSLAHYCPQFGLRCTLFVPNTVSPLLVDSLRSKGAEVFQEEMAQIYPRYESYLKEQPGSVRFDQLFDFSKRRHYYQLGKIIKSHINGPIHAIVGSVGTGHSLIGTAEGCEASWVISTEPEAGLRVPGVRNIETDRYGELDQLSPRDFNERLIIRESNLPKGEFIETSLGRVLIGNSFRLVLAGISQFLEGKSKQTVFALGASLKRI